MNIQDIRANRIKKIIEQENIQWLSLDIFDTTIWRTVPKPTDLFYLVGAKLKEKGFFWPNTSPTLFAKTRIESEKKAREYSYKERETSEVNLEEIYAQFPKGFLKKGKIKDLIEIEVETEYENTVLDKYIQDIIKTAQQHNLKIVFVSDTYLSQNAIEKILRQHQNKPAFSYDKLFLSWAYGTPKPLKLFDHVLKKLDVAPEQILHVGDNSHADIVAAKKRKIKTVHWKAETKDFKEILSKEKPHLSFKVEELLDKNHGDFGLTALRNRVIYSDSMPEALSGQEDFFALYGSRVIGPVLTNFMNWVHHRAVEEKAPHVLFMMREGTLLKSLFDKINDHAKTNIQTSEVFVSRYATLKASIFFATKDELTTFIERPSPLKITDFLEEFDIDQNELGSSFPLKTNTFLNTLEKVKVFLNYIDKNKDIRQKIIQKSAEERKGFINHLKSLIDLEKNKKIYFVDLGYSGTIQKNIQKIFEYENLDSTTHGFYLITKTNIKKLQDIGGIAEGYMVEGGEPISISHAVTRSPEVLEQCCMSNCGSTLSYKTDGAPVLGDIHIPNTQQKQIFEIQKGIEVYCDYWLSYKTTIKSFDPNNKNYKKLISNILLRSITQPNDAEIKFLGSWIHDENFGTNKTRCLIDITPIKDDIPFFSAHQLASVSSKTLYWPFAVAQKINPQLGSALHHIYSRTIEPESFNAHQKEENLIVYFDTGNGFSDKEAILYPYTPSCQNQLRAKVSVDLHNTDIRAIAIRPFGNKQIMRFDKIIIRIAPKSGQSANIHFANTIGAQSLNFIGFENIIDRLYLSTHHMPFIAWAPDQAIKNFSGKVTIDIFLGLMTLKQRIA